MTPRRGFLASNYVNECFLASRLQRFHFWRQREKERASLLQASLWFNLLQASIWIITSSTTLACFQTALLQNTSMLPKLQGFNASIGFLASSFNVVHCLKLQCGSLLQVRPWLASKLPCFKIRQCFQSFKASRLQ